jgi:hypothetical protein
MINLNAFGNRKFRLPVLKKIDFGIERCQGRNKVFKAVMQQENLSLVLSDKAQLQKTACLIT